MRRKAIEALLIIVCFILQCTVFQALALAGIVPNLLLIVTSSLGFMRGEKEGMAVGFFSGLLMDIFFGQLFGAADVFDDEQDEKREDDHALRQA